jgi:hypothetical protein
MVDPMTSRELVARLEARREAILRYLPQQLFTEFNDITKTLQIIQSEEVKRIQESLATQTKTIPVPGASSGGAVSICGSASSPSPLTVGSSRDAGSLTIIGPDGKPWDSSTSIRLSPSDAHFLGGQSHPTITTTSAVPTRIPMAIQRQRLVEFLLQHGACTRAVISERTGIPLGSLSELLKGDEFVQVLRGLWAHKDHQDVVKQPGTSAPPGSEKPT